MCFRRRILKTVLVSLPLALIVGCGGPQGGPGADRHPPGDDAGRYKVKSRSDASLFLSRATFGSTEEEIDKLMKLGNYERWIDEQIHKTPTFHMRWMNEHLKGVGGTGDLSTHPEDWKRYSDTLGYAQRDVWWHIVTYAPDQLRQRVAFALSEILVVSRKGPLSTFPDARVSYYDTLVRYALGNYEDLLRAVTYHPAMGKYLSYLGNPKADPARGTHPDENYARELMQLFTIGLYRLNPDGSKTIRQGRFLPTYTQKDVKEMARIFTGLSDDNGEFPAEAAFSSHHSRTSAMVPFEQEHDSGAKTVLGHTIDGGGVRGDIEAAIHLLFMHPNVGPFLARRLIQRLVTDNPSGAYIRRVASVFDDNGSGVRGDLAAVVKAILLDPEALEGTKRFPRRFGKFREPLLYFSHLFRAFRAEGNRSAVLRIYDDGPAYRYESFHFHGTGMTRQEGPLEALTVFNYFSPDDGPADLKRQGLVAPELVLYGKQGIDDVIMGILTRNGFVYDTYDLYIDLDLSRQERLAAAGKFVELVDGLDLLLTGGKMDEGAKRVVVDYLRRAKNEEGSPLSPDTLARYAAGLVMTSPAYAFER